MILHHLTTHQRFLNLVMQFSMLKTWKVFLLLWQTWSSNQLHNSPYWNKVSVLEQGRHYTVQHRDWEPVHGFITSCSVIYSLKTLWMYCVFLQSRAWPHDSVSHVEETLRSFVYVPFSPLTIVRLGMKDRPLVLCVFGEKCKREAEPKT